MNNTPSFREDHISQIPALQMLQKLGYTYLSPGEAMRGLNCDFYGLYDMRHDYHINHTIQINHSSDNFKVLTIN
jgi:hypothetical protein